MEILKGSDKLVPLSSCDKLMEELEKAGPEG
jgi:hypothetical protein